MNQNQLKTELNDAPRPDEAFVGLTFLSATPHDWVEVVLSDFDLFLQDHAQCEHKAMASALALASRFSECRALVEPMICLAKEELDHFHQVYRIVNRRGLHLSVAQPDSYVKALRKLIRSDDQGYFLDRLLIAALIEARSAERLMLLAEFLPHSKEACLAPFYRNLAQVEKGHWKVFSKLAKHYYPDTWYSRFQFFVNAEKSILEHLPLVARVH